MIIAYYSDDVYVFDEDHAMVAFPFKLLRELRTALATHHVAPLVTAESEFLKRVVKDRSGHLPSLDVILS
jgi:hypothetical protein